MSANSPPQLDWRREAVDGSGRLVAQRPLSSSPARKAAIVAQMQALDRPVTSTKLYARLDRAWSLKAIEYHRSTLVKAKVVEIVFGPELRFRLTDRAKGSTTEMGPLELAD